MHTQTETLESRLVGDIAGEFFVPSYQRGYRWGRDEVTRLLTDIAEANGQRYFLQPIVVKPMADGRLELVDGQQRLTTLYLILGHLRSELPRAARRYTLDYETRSGSAAFLDAPAYAQSRENIDFHHIFSAVQAIEKWFSNQADPTTAAINLYKALTESVYVIWYEAPASLDSADLFRRLNVGRIPLTDAELVKGLLLHRGGDRAKEIAAQWDGIEKDLRNPEVWAFLTGTPSPRATHLDLLLDALAGGPSGRDRPLFHTFETLRPRIDEAPYGLWAEVVDLHATVLGWYEDREMFHKVGFLVSGGLTFEALIASTQNLTKSAHHKVLDAKIRGLLELDENSLRSLRYDSHRKKAGQALLLMNVLTVQGASSSQERYSFREHASRKWSLEHIHAQNAEDLNRADQWRVWLGLHAEALADLPTSREPARDELVAEVKDLLLRDRANGKNSSLTQQTFREYEGQLVQFFNEGAESDDVHSIANLALLSSADNSSISNSAFEVKRRDILVRDRNGSYIPVCTRNIFLKYYSTAAGQQLHFWGPQDRADYLEAIVAVLKPYLTSEAS